MPDYAKSKIYKITCNVTGLCYIGSTTQELEDRMKRHKNIKGNNYKSLEIIKNNDYIYEVIENYPCENKIELRQREQFYIDSIECVNKHNAYGLDIENYKEYQKKYAKKNLEKKNQQAKDRYNKNEELRQKKREYELKNKEKISQRQKEYRAKKKAEQSNP